MQALSSVFFSLTPQSISSKKEKLPRSNKEPQFMPAFYAASLDAPSVARNDCDAPHHDIK